MKQFFAWCIAAALAISLRGCGQEAARRPVEEIPATPQIQTGMICLLYTSHAPEPTPAVQRFLDAAKAVNHDLY